MVVLVLLLSLLSASAGAAQLRPLDPMDWEAVDGRRDMSFRVGVGAYHDQSASLAGTRGLLLEIGAYRGTWSFGRAAIQLSGTAVRFFRDHSTFAPPLGATRPYDGADRVDAGDHRVSTLVRLTEAVHPWALALRFGVRLPTTDNREGLERDRTDFFTTFGARHDFGALDVRGEMGLGIMGTRDDGHEQVDPVLFAVKAVWDLGWIRPDLAVVGQHDTRDGADRRGNEDLGEIRLGLTGGEGHWFRVGVVRGWRDFSPAFGVVLEAGFDD